MMVVAQAAEPAGELRKHKKIQEIFRSSNPQDMKGMRKKSRDRTKVTSRFCTGWVVAS